MWIYKVKPDTMGDISRFKARFVPKGCSQRVGLDYTETISPIIRMTSLRLFLAIAAARDLEMGQLDINNVFLYALIKEDVYIRQLLGFSDGTSKVCHLKRCLYGLKQSPREFNMLLRAWLVDNGVATMHLGPLHLHLPRWSRFRYDRTLRGRHSSSLQ
jgi:hypothetical protein